MKLSCLNDGKRKKLWEPYIDSIYLQNLVALSQIPLICLLVLFLYQICLHSWLRLFKEHTDYQSALEVTKLETLVCRRLKLCKKFALKSSKHPKHSKWFVRTEPGPSTRSKKPEYKIPLCRLERTSKGPIPYLTNLLNSK